MLIKIQYFVVKVKIPFKKNNVLAEAVTIFIATFLINVLFMLACGNESHP